ncbi:acetyl-CoA carboxylase biotin carboxyl carrier protein [Anaeropeptidivorans aminofermentans]|uniref:acetyl-CoA carboxylase biotin carboxyl carrier protein n=1 Tax=Anaeropeptidivorans aminofermentans TaxID=2934315 RepID=UPI0020244FF2|nr:acetyl-CoA carboxylase biotin carboxyl carrier protein [Anaeropeptidivorans aminofermentans]
MDFNNIKELISLIDKSSLTELDLKFENTEIRLSKNKNSTGSVKEASKPVVSVPEIKEEGPITILPVEEKEVKEGFIVKSPLVGTFYESHSPGKPPYVSVGSTVKEGDILCIVEAMKVMNEITSEKSGEIAEIFIKDGEMVEYGQPIFRII